MNVGAKSSKKPNMSPKVEKEVMIKCDVQCLNKGYNLNDTFETLRVRKVNIRPGQAWNMLEKEIKKECNYATIRKIKYVDQEGDHICIVDGEELEFAIFTEGILRFTILFFKHEIMYTVQYMNSKTPDEPNNDFGTRKAYPAYPTSTNGTHCAPKVVRKANPPTGSVWEYFLHTIQEICKNAVIKKIKYTDHSANEICIVHREELENAIFIEGNYKFHILIETEIIYTAQHLSAKQLNKPDKNIGIRKAYPLPSSLGCNENLAWNIMSSTIIQMYASAEMKKVKYTDKKSHDVYIVNWEELERAIFSEGIGLFHVLYDYEAETAGN